MKKLTRKIKTMGKKFFRTMLRKANKIADEKINGAKVAGSLLSFVQFLLHLAHISKVGWLFVILGMAIAMNRLMRFMAVSILTGIAFYAMMSYAGAFAIPVSAWTPVVWFLVILASAPAAGSLVFFNQLEDIVERSKPVV